MRLTTILCITSLFIISVASTNIYAQNAPTNFVALFQEQISETETSLCYMDVWEPVDKNDAKDEVLSGQEFADSQSPDLEFRGIRPDSTIDVTIIPECCPPFCPPPPTL